MHVRLVATVVGWWILSSTAGAQTVAPAYDEEIARLRRELSQIQSERRRVREESAKDAKEFAEYRKRTESRLAGIVSETDSIRRVIRSNQQRNDSLQSLIASSSSSKRHLDLLQENFRKRLIAGCDSLLIISKLLPPMASLTFTNTLSFLRSELAAAGIENSEGVNRLAHIARDMNESHASIQIMQGASPVADIRGTAYRLRIGSLFEAVVDEKGTVAALWSGYDGNGSPQWEISRDPTVATHVLRSINIREGKAVPSLVELPLGSNRVPGEKL